jgi:eukaryotic-like serine/threonine-protein kinase
MGDVYLARLTGQEGFQRLVAIKLIHEHLTNQPQFVKMFIDEARLASRITHPNVAMTLDLGKVDRTHFIAMEYVNGESVVALLRQARPPLRYCARIIADAAAGLHAAHELCGEEGEPLHVVHRDISPSNILISYDGAVKVVDFGVARARGGLHTTSGEIKGKFSYMAPEQLRSPRTVDRRADIFALGIVLFEMTTWKRLFGGAGEDEQVSKVLACQIPRPSSLAAGDYPPELERIVLRALATKPEDRYQSAKGLGHDLEQFIAASGKPVPPAAIGEMMHKVFEGHIAEKQELLRRCERESPGELPTDLQVSSAGSSLVLESAASLFTTRRSKVAVGLVAVAALVLGVGVSLPYLLRSSSTGAAPGRGGTRPPGVEAGPSGAREITISAAAEPEAASLRWGGEAVKNPFVLKRPAGKGETTLDIAAEGYVSQRILVPLAEGGSFKVKLERQKEGTGAVGAAPAETGAGAARSKRPARGGAGREPAKRPSSRSGKPKVDDDDVLSNPYH